MTDRRTGTAGLDKAYDLTSPEEAKGFYDGWAATYEAELRENGYVTPERCAKALAIHAKDPAAPLIEFGCGTGLGGIALRAAGFTAIDGTDISGEMLERAGEKGVYRSLSTLDLSRPFPLGDNTYANAAAIGCVNPAYMPVTVLDEMLRVIARGGCLVFSLNDRSGADGTVLGRINELLDCSAADLLVRDHGAHIPGTGLRATVFMLRKR